MMNFGLLGCGRIGQVHARSLGRIAGARVAAVSDPVAPAAEALAADTGARVLAPEALIEDAGVDVVVIGTPTTTHYDLIHQVAAAGKAIFCEKPVDLSVARVEEVRAMLAATPVPFFVAFQRRFDPNNAQLARRLRDGEIGEIEQIILTSRDPGPPPIDYIRSSGGIFRDMTIHDFDLARFLLDEEPVEVFASGACLVDPAIGEAGDCDTAAVTLKTKSGRMVQISNSRRATFGHDQRIEVLGAKGMLRTANLLETNIESAGTAGFTRAPALNFFLERYEAAYLAEMVYFVDALQTGAPLRPSIEDGLQAQRLADAAARSAERNEVVQLT